MAPLIDTRREDEFVFERGEVVNWRRAYKCSCGMRIGEESDANRASVNCSVCDGLGFTYAAPTALVAMITQIEYQKQLLDAGIASPGSLLMSLSPFDDHFVSSYDVINFTYSLGEPYEGDGLIRRADQPDLLSYTPVVVLSCFFVDQSNADTITLFQQDVDFSLSGRHLIWLTDKGPPIGGNYTIKYNARFDWEVYSDPSVRFEVGNSIGQRVLLRKRELPVPLFAGESPDSSL